MRIVHNEKAKVYLIDDHPLFRESLANLINRQDDMLVTGHAGGAGSALRDMVKLKPNLAIVDLSLDDGSGLDLIKTVRNILPNLAILVLSMHDEEYYAERCIRAGATGYVMKRDSGTRILAAARATLAGRMSVSETVAAAFAQRFVSHRKSVDRLPIEALSDRELEVFGLLGHGLTTRQVAESMNVSVKTVRAFCSRIKQKLYLNTSSELVRDAVHWCDQNGDSRALKSR